MCGFAGVVTLDGSAPPRDALARMISVIRHRGPDESGLHVSGQVGLGFQRLSILDLSPNGHQPMLADDGRAAIVFNGEIYNYRELRTELEARGHTFRSEGDTEVLLHAYLEWGRDCLGKLNGMFAFLIHDARRRIVFGARDRFGEKPLFYAPVGDRVLFGSEIKTIRASPWYEPAFDLRVAADMLLAGSIDTPRETHETLYRGIRQLPAAHAFELDLDGTWRCWRYWSLDAISPDPVPDPVGAFADLFEQSVRLRLRSDVPVGVFLSGGMDSTSIICSMKRQMDGIGSGDGTLRAFCFHAEGFDETRYINDTIRQTGATHTALRAGPLDLWNALDRFFWHQEEPVHSITAVVGYKLMELAAAHGVKVVLNGQGADETLAGYPTYFASYWHSLLNRGRLLRVWHEIDRYSRAHGGSRPGLMWTALLRFVRVHLQDVSWYRSASSRRSRARMLADPWYVPDFTRHVAPTDIRKAVGGLRHVLQGSVTRDPLPLYLRVEDRNSMAHSVEARLPFLDHRLVELVFRLGPDWLMRGPWNKFLLREAMRSRIPEAVRTRVDKMGFPTPIAEWLRGPLYELAREVVMSKEARERGIYNVDSIARDLERHRKGEINVAGKLWDVIQWERVARVAGTNPAVIPSGAPSGCA